MAPGHEAQGSSSSNVSIMVVNPVMIQSQDSSPTERVDLGTDVADSVPAVHDYACLVMPVTAGLVCLLIVGGVLLAAASNGDHVF